MRQKTNRPRDGWDLAGQAGAARRGSGCEHLPEQLRDVRCLSAAAPERSIPHAAAPSLSPLGCPKASPRLFPTCQHALAPRWKQSAMLRAQPLASCLPRGLFCSGRAWR